VRMTTETLRSAGGYRGRAWAKSRLAQLGRLAEWPKVLEAGYNPHTDRITGLGEVRWEGSVSREILAAHGSDDSGCDPCKD
jgi:hypothetical protein